EQGGNSFGTTAILGTNDSNDLHVIADGNSLATFSQDGSITFQNPVDSTAAFKIQNANGDEVFKTDTTNSSTFINELNSGSLQSWQVANDLPNPRIDESSDVAKRYGYVIGGQNNGSTVDTVYYAKLNTDGSVGSWQTANNLPAVRQAFQAVTANGYVY